MSTPIIFLDKSHNVEESKLSKEDPLNFVEMLVEGAVISSAEEAPTDAESLHSLHSDEVWNCFIKYTEKFYKYCL